MALRVTGTIRGLPEAPITNATLEHVNRSAKSGMKIYHARGIHFVDSEIKVRSGKPVTIKDGEVTGLK